MKGRPLIVVAFLALAVIAAETPKPNAAAKSARNFDALMQLGQDCLYAGDYKAARDAFHDANMTKPGPKPLHGLGLSYLYLGDMRRANTYMQRAMDGSGAKPDRSLVLNMAMLQIGMNQPLRGVKIVQDYLTPRKKETDEGMLNALGSALFLANRLDRRNPLWGRAADFYVEYQKTVEATRKGQKRWGVEWLPEKEADSKYKAMRDSYASADEVGAKLDAQEIKVLEAKRFVRRSKVGVEKGFSTEATVRSGEEKVKKEEAEFERLAKEYDAAMDRIVRPIFPRILTPVALDDLTPSKPTVVAAVYEDPAYKKALEEAAKAPDPARRSTSVPVDEPVATETTKPPTPKVEEPAAPVIAMKPEAGREVKVRQYAAAFAVAEDLVVTAAPVVDGAIELQLEMADGSSAKAELVRKDEKSGLALLRLVGAEKKLPYFSVGDNFPGGTVQCACFPTVDLFNPSMELLTGSTAAPKDSWTVKLPRHPRLAGSPLIAGLKVIGVVMADRDSPLDQLPAVGVEAIRELVGADAGKGAGTRDASAATLQLMAVRKV